MAAVKKSVPKRKPLITASDVTVGNRTLEAVLMDLAERSARVEERSARAEERSARAEERSVRTEERMARAEEQLALVGLQLADIGYKLTMAIDTLGSVSRDLVAHTQEMRAANARTDARLTALEGRPGA